MPSDEYADENPHPHLTYTPPTFDQWVRCPDCHSKHGPQIRLREAEADETVWFRSNIQVWFECMSCGHESIAEGASFVEQPEQEPMGLIEKIKEIFT